MATADLSRLEMCREVLLANGIESKNVLDTGGGSDMAKAEEFLEQAARDLQIEEQWAFHENLEYEVTPDGDGYISIPTGTMLIRAENSRTTDVYAQRGGKLINITDNTDVFTDDTVKVRLYLRYEVDCLPPHVRYYAMRRAARLLCEYKGGGPRFNLLWQHEMRAKATALKADNDIRRTNTLHTQESRQNRGDIPARTFT